VAAISSAIANKMCTLFFMVYEFFWGLNYVQR
jgi:hypothetical protein